MLTFPAIPSFGSLRTTIGGPKHEGHLAIPGHFLHWLGFAPEMFEQTASGMGLSCFSYAPTDIGVPNVAPDCMPADDFSEPAKNQSAQLSESVAYATCVQSDVLPSELNDTHTPLQRRWRELIEANYQQTRKLFKAQRPNLVLLLQGFHPQNATARCVALELDIPVLAVENTALADRVVWDCVSGLTNRNAAHQFYWRHKDRFANNVYQEYCERLIRDTKRLKSAEHTSPVDDAMPENPAPQDHHGLTSATVQKPYVLFLGQVYTDASQVFGLRQWRSPLEVLRSCVQWCRQHDHDLVLKLHPKENSGVNTIDNRPYDRLTYRKITADTELADQLQQMNAVIDYDNQHDTYRLIENASIAVTVNSQSGLEAAIRGVPVVVCGNAYFGGLDFTFDAPRPEFFYAAMQTAAHSGKSAVAPATAIPRTNRAREFAHIFFEHYCRLKTPGELLQLIQEVLR